MSLFRSIFGRSRRAASEDVAHAVDGRTRRAASEDAAHAVDIDHLDSTDPDWDGDARLARAESSLRTGMGLELVTSIYGPELAAEAQRRVEGEAAAAVLMVDDETTDAELITIRSPAPQDLQAPDTDLMDGYDRPLTVDLQMPMSTAFQQWIQASFAAKNVPVRKDLLVASTAKQKNLLYCQFKDALITEFTIPAMDSSSKNKDCFTIKFGAKRITKELNTNKKIADLAGAGFSRKRWSKAGFRLHLGDLPCEGVSKISELHVKLTNIAYKRNAPPVKWSGPLEVTNLKVTFSASDREAWEKAYMAGHVNDLSGVIEFLDPSADRILGTVKLHDVEIASLQRAHGSPGQDQQCTAELSIGSISLITA